MAECPSPGRIRAKHAIAMKPHRSVALRAGRVSGHSLTFFESRAITNPRLLQLIAPYRRKAGTLSRPASA